MTESEVAAYKRGAEDMRRKIAKWFSNYEFGPVPRLRDQRLKYIPGVPLQIRAIKLPEPLP